MVLYTKGCLRRIRALTYTNLVIPLLAADLTLNGSRASAGTRAEYKILDVRSTVSQVIDTFGKHLGADDVT